MMNNFQCENDPVLTVNCVCVQERTCLTLDLSLIVRMCCLPEESSAFSLSVWNAVSMKSSLKMDAHNAYTINHRPFTEKGTQNAVNWQQPSSIINHRCREQYWDINSAFRFTSPGTNTVTLYQATAPRSHLKDRQEKNYRSFFSKFLFASFSSKCIFNALMEE